MQIPFPKLSGGNTPSAPRRMPDDPRAGRKSVLLGTSAQLSAQGATTMRAQNAAVKPFDVARLEEDVREAVTQRPHIQAVEYTPRTAPPPVPEYVVHREDVSEIGKLSAEAI